MMASSSIGSARKSLQLLLLLIAVKTSIKASFSFSKLSPAGIILLYEWISIAIVAGIFSLDSADG